MNIIVAKHAGFCSGVKRAIETTEETALNDKAYVYGQLVHNERVIEDLEKKGIKFVEDIDDIPENAHKHTPYHSMQFLLLFLLLS